MSIRLVIHDEALTDLLQGFPGSLRDKEITQNSIREVEHNECDEEFPSDRLEGDRSNLK